MSEISELFEKRKKILEKIEREEPGLKLKLEELAKNNIAVREYIKTSDKISALDYELLKANLAINSIDFEGLQDIASIEALKKLAKRLKLKEE